MFSFPYFLSLLEGVYINFIIRRKKYKLFLKPAEASLHRNCLLSELVLGSTGVPQKLPCPPRNWNETSWTIIEGCQQCEDGLTADFQARGGARLSKESPLEEEAFVVHAGCDPRGRLETVFQAGGTA